MRTLQCRMIHLQDEEHRRLKTVKVLIEHHASPLSKDHLQQIRKIFTLYRVFVFNNFHQSTMVVLPDGNGKVPTVNGSNTPPECRKISQSQQYNKSFRLNLKFLRAFELHPFHIIRCLLLFAFVATIAVMGCHHFSRNLPSVNQLLFNSPIDPLAIALNGSVIASNLAVENHRPLIGKSSLSPADHTPKKTNRKTINKAKKQTIEITKKNKKTKNEKTDPPVLVHNMTDADLFWWASTLSQSFAESKRRDPKVAFLFLTRGPLPLAPLWERFFKGNEGKYSVYVHASPSYEEKFSRKSVFYGRRIPSKEVRWGSLSVVAAEHRLLAAALLDLSNQRFVLLSESCIPIFPFNTVYDYLMNSTESFVEVFDRPLPHARGRYNWGMWPAITIYQWRKGSQWFEVDRRVAMAVVSDINYTVAFAKHYVHCPDEHYLPTFMNINFGAWCANRSLTYVDWSEGRYHPKGFRSEDITWELLWKMRNAHRYTYNGERTSLCMLFARKMFPDSIHKLLKLAPKALGF